MFQNKEDRTGFLSRLLALIRQVKQWKGYLLLGIVLIVFLALGLVFAVQSLDRTRDIKASALYTKGTQCVEAGETLKAYRYFAKASNKEPDKAVYARKAALAAWDEELRANARKYAIRAWKHGTRQFEILKVIINSGVFVEHSFRPEQQLNLFEQFAEASRQRNNSDSGETEAKVQEDRKRALALLNESIPKAGYWVRRGDIHYLLGEREKAVDLWLEGLEEKPRPDIVAKVANRYIATEEFDAAEKLLEQYHGRGIINGNALGMLIGLYTRHGEFQRIPPLIEEANASGHYDIHLRACPKNTGIKFFLYLQA